MSRYFIISVIAFATNLLGLTPSIAQVANVETESESSKIIKLPVIGISAGWSFLQGDVENDGSGTGAIGQIGYSLTIDQSIFNFLSLSLDIGTTKFYGEQMASDSININYRSVVFTQDLKFLYEASHLFKKNEKGFIPFQPYIGVGVGLISYRAKGDLKDENGSTYNYWSDGSIRNLSENAINQDQAINIQRDYIYETELRDANLDGFGRYDQMALHIPVELGFRYQFTKHIGAHIKGSYNLNFTDLIDNVNELSLGKRQGLSGNDNHLSVMIGLSVYLGNHHKQKSTVPPVQVIAIGNDQTLNPESSIGSNSQDKADATTISLNETDSITGNQEPTLTEELKSNNVSEESIATDSEGNVNDTVPQSNTELNTALGTTIETNSGGGDKELNSTNEVVVSNQVGSIESPNSELSIIDLIDQAKGIESTSPKPAGIFHWADLNKNKYISPDEVLHFIDLLFEDNSKFTVPMIHGLIEYYFDQD